MSGIIKKRLNTLPGVKPQLPGKNPSSIRLEPKRHKKSFTGALFWCSYPHFIEKQILKCQFADNGLKNKENLKCQKYVKYAAKNLWWATMSAMHIM
jgi:hypothetical protein